MQNISITHLPKAGNGVTTLIEGQLVISKAEELKQALEDLLNRYQSIEIELKNITRLDISALQLFVALYHSAKARQKDLHFHVEENDYVTKILKHSGFQSFFNQQSSISV